MQLQYILNESGEKQSVIIPYHEWKKIRNRLDEPTDSREKKQFFNPVDYFGIYKERNLNLDEEIENLRDEWTRDI